LARTTVELLVSNVRYAPDPRPVALAEPGVTLVPCHVPWAVNG